MIAQEHKDRISEAYRTSISYNIDTILKGSCLVVDPSSGGHSSLPAFTIVDKGKIVESFEVEISPKLRSRGAYIAHRLREIVKGLDAKLAGRSFDLLAMELIYHIPSENTVMKSFQQLTMSMGAIHSAVDAKYRIVVPAWEWHKLRDSKYVKSDINDSILMAKAIVKEARAQKKVK